MLDVPESLLDERRRLGLDVFDEVWGGVPHMVPPPSGEHQRLELKLGSVLLSAATRRGLVASNETGLFAADDDYRVPDIVVSQPANCSQRGVDDTAELVVELRSPGDESSEKLPWYAARGVAEILVVDPGTRQFELYRTEGGGPSPSLPTSTTGSRSTRSVRGCSP
jgi:Uma2 family endonuclease